MPLEIFLQYLLPMSLLISGILGIFFSKSGEWKRLNAVGWVLLALTVVSGGITILNVQISRERAREQALTIEKQRNDLAKVRNLLVASVFAKDDVPLKSLFIIAEPLNSSPSGDASGSTNPPSKSDWAPFVREGVKTLSIKLSLEEVLDYDLTVSKGLQGRLEILSKYYDYGEKVCHAYIPAHAQNSQYEDKTKCTRSNKSLDSFSFDVVPSNAFIINLPADIPFWKLFSRISQQIKVNGFIGEIQLDVKDDRIRALAEADLLDAEYEFKIFKKYRADKECYSALEVKFRPHIKVEKGNRKLILDRIADVDVNLCELVPI